MAGGELGVNLKIGDRVIVSAPPGEVVGEVIHTDRPPGAGLQPAAAYQAAVLSLSLSAEPE